MKNEFFTKFIENAIQQQHQHPFKMSSKHENILKRKNFKKICRKHDFILFFYSVFLVFAGSKDKKSFHFFPHCPIKIYNFMSNDENDDEKGK